MEEPCLLTPSCQRDSLFAKYTDLTSYDQVTLVTEPYKMATIGKHEQNWLHYLAESLCCIKTVAATIAADFVLKVAYCPERDVCLYPEMWSAINAVCTV